MKRQHFLLSNLKTISVGRAQPRPQGAFPWLWRWGTFKAREKGPGDEVGPGWDLNPRPPAQRTDALPNELTMLWFSKSCVITELLSYRTCSRTLRSTDQKLLAVPKSRLKTYEDRAFSVAVPKLWNELPLDLRSLVTINLFKKHLKTDLFKKAYNV